MGTFVPTVSVWGVSVPVSAFEDGKGGDPRIPSEWTVWKIDPKNHFPLGRQDVVNILRIAYAAQTSRLLYREQRMRTVDGCMERLFQWISENTHDLPMSGPLIEKRRALGIACIGHAGSDFRMEHFDEIGRPKPGIVARICEILDIKD